MLFGLGLLRGVLSLLRVIGVVWTSRAKVTDIKWNRDRCGRFDDIPANASTSGNFIPLQGYRPNLAYALRIAARANGNRSMKLLPESIDTQASMLLVAAAPAVVMTRANQPKVATPGLPILPLITKRDAEQAACSEASIHAAVLATRVDIYGNRTDRCSGPAETETDGRCPLLGARNSTYVLSHKVYCSAACVIKGDEAFAKVHSTATLETRHAVQLDGNQPSASSSDPAPGSNTAPSQESSKAGLQNHEKSGKEALHTQMKQAIDAKSLIPTATILETETISSLITSIADYILSIVGQYGKGTPATDLDPGAKNIHLKTFRRFPNGAKAEKEKAYVAVFNMIHAFQPLFIRNRSGLSQD